MVTKYEAKMNSSRNKAKPALQTALQIRRMKEDKFVHFLNPGAIRYTRSLGDAAGLETLGVHLVRLKGDFMGFVAGSEPHAMTNPHIKDLLYLVGGNRCPLDVCDYPRINKRRYRENGKNAYVDLAALIPVKRNLK